jgi:hypothetical protein
MTMDRLRGSLSTVAIKAPVRADGARVCSYNRSLSGSRRQIAWHIYIELQ